VHAPVAATKIVFRPWRLETQIAMLWIIFTKRFETRGRNEFGQRLKDWRFAFPAEKTKGSGIGRSVLGSSFLSFGCTGVGQPKNGQSTQRH